MADPKITSERGWNQLTWTMGKKMPGRLGASRQARRKLTNLMKGKAGQ